MLAVPGALPGSSKGASMSKHKPGMSVGEQWLVSAWDAVRDLERDYGVVVFFAALPLARAGVFQLRAGAFRMSEGEIYEDPVAEYVTEYPSSQISSLEAAIYRCAWQLAAIVYSGMEKASALDKTAQS